MARTTLHEGWRLSATRGPVPDAVRGRTVPAAVPGSVHLDLRAAGLIPDPYLDRVEAELVWMHRTDWQYRLTFEATAAQAGEHVDLVFDGLDTVAAITLNGELIGTTANMHRSYRFDVRPHLVDGANELTVDFSSALQYAEEKEAELGRRDHVYPHAFNMVRKMACSFGWDWGPDLQTAGMWKPVRLERWHTARLGRVRPLVSVEPDGTGVVEVHADIERAAAEGPQLVLTTEVGGHRARAVLAAGDTTAVLRGGVPGARMWWPAGYGDQPLYDLRVTLATAERPEEPLDAVDRRVGFRNITVDTAPDETGTPFTFVVNGTRIFAKGANWIPDDHFLTRITRGRLERRVDQALGAHMNMLRVWGGGIYETDDFYDVCDERGMLVWQDFPFACAAYPEEEPLRGEVEAEARENVARLAGHPSLALWNGGNENLWGYADWGWPEQLVGRTWGLGYYTEVLPRIVADLDPTTPYADGSPYTPGAPVGGTHPNDQNHGTRHEWEVWNRLDYTTYRDHIPRFCSEFGFQGPPTWATLTRWIHDEPLTPSSPAFLLHQKAEDGNGKLDRGMAPHLPRPLSFTDWHWATQLNQARAVAFGIEHFRSWWPRTAGSLVWQLNDCWPVTSWAAVDSDERPKPLWYALRGAYAPRLLTFQPREGRLAVVVVNDTGETWAGRLVLERQTLEGVVRADAKVELRVGPRSVVCVKPDDSLLTPEEARQEVLVASSEGVRAVHTFCEDRDLAYRPDALSAQAHAEPGGYRVDVRATSFARDVAVLADHVADDATVDDMLVTLLPGESHTFHVRTRHTLDPAVLTAVPVLRSVNSLCPTTPEIG
ncbi:glycoside hydrolase family 2 protein [Streptomyces sp. AgN23]|uniref:glycoside hydrolase family 2 protein n=1 Tax=Streptomyces sp. AgN23 TaxID=1188315 RepID=UPI001B33484C|nr:glycoside hydrolase family 2 protein [Streptomyces sp. AgN23]QTI90545.1 glycoside hydrolase family 2 protein [Streptomyces sp. AgN23]WTB11150.1 glycoside hydrolase family 2 protein [Streptomyces antimycoticus]